MAKIMNNIIGFYGAREDFPFKEKFQRKEKGI